MSFVRKYLLSFCWNWRDERLPIERTLANRDRQYKGYPVAATYFGSYSMDGLAVALWAVRNTRSFDACIERVINFLGDADSHGSIAGQIAGAFYGYRSLNPRFKKHLNRWDDHEVALRGVLLYHARDTESIFIELTGSPLLTTRPRSSAPLAAPPTRKSL